MHIWATCTTTLSYTQISPVQVQTFLLAFPRFPAGANPQPNLDSAVTYHHSFLLRKRQDCVFRCDCVSTSSLWTYFSRLNSYIAVSAIYKTFKVSHEAWFQCPQTGQDSRWDGLPIYNRVVQFFKILVSFAKLVLTDRAEVDGFEPSKCRSQSPVPYHLAIPQYVQDAVWVCNQID